MSKALSKYEIQKLIIGTIAYFLLSLGAGLSMVAQLEIAVEVKILIVTGGICTSVGGWLGGFFTQGEKPSTNKSNSQGE